MYIDITCQQKIHYKTPPITLVLKYICNVLYFVTWIFSTQIYFICSSLKMFVGVSFEIIQFKSKFNATYLK